MNITLHKDDFLQEKTGRSLFYYVLQALGIPRGRRGVIDQVDVEVERFETFKEDE